MSILCRPFVASLVPPMARSLVGVATSNVKLSFSREKLQMPDLDDIYRIEKQVSMSCLPGKVKKFFGDPRPGAVPNIEFCWSRAIQATLNRPLTERDHRTIDQLWDSLKTYTKLDAQSAESQDQAIKISNCFKALGLVAYKSKLEDLVGNGPADRVIDNVSHHLKRRGPLMYVHKLHVISLIGTAKVGGEAYVVVHDPHIGQSKTMLYTITRLLLDQGKESVDIDSLAEMIGRQMLLPERLPTLLPQVRQVCSGIVGPHSVVTQDNLQQCIRHVLQDIPESTVAPTLWRVSDLLDNEPVNEGHVIPGDVPQVFSASHPSVHIQALSTSERPYTARNGYWGSWEFTRGLEELPKA